MVAIQYLAESPGLCIFLSAIFFLLGYIMVHCLLGSLLKMHRSKSALKKIISEYSMFQKAWFVPHERDCIHAVKFCKVLVWTWRIRCVVFVLYLFLSVVSMMSAPINVFTSWFCVGMIAVFDCPLFVIHFLLVRPFVGRFREYSFEKYHNTKDHESLV